MQAVSRRCAVFCLALCLALGQGAVAQAQQNTAPQVTLQSVDGVALQGSTATLDLTLGVRNPGPLALPLHKLRFALQLDGVNLAQGISTAPVTIPAQQQALVPVQISVDGPSLLGLIATLPADGSVHYLLTGTAEIGQTLLQIPFRHGGVVRWIAQ